MAAGKAEIWFSPVLPEINLISTCNIQDLTLNSCAAALELSGELKFYDKKGDSGNGVSLGFCPNCGSNILGKPEGTPDVVVLTAGSLDDPNQYQPSMDIYTESAPSWDHLDQNTVKFSGMFSLE